MVNYFVQKRDEDFDRPLTLSVLGPILDDPRPHRKNEVFIIP